MQANPKRRGARGDEAVQRTILALVLAVFPVLCTIPELSREIGNREVVERAVRALVGYDLIELCGVTLLPTPAALRCHRLDSW